MVARLGSRAVAALIMAVKVSSRIWKVPLIVPLAAGLLLHALSMVQVAATATGVTPTVSAYCDAASPQLRDIMVAIAVLSALSPVPPAVAVSGGACASGGERVPVGMVNGGSPTSSKVGMGSSGTPWKVCGTTSAMAGPAAQSATMARAATGRLA